MKRYIFKLFFFFVIIAFAGCVKEPSSVFEKDSSERLNDFVVKAREALKSQKQGWIVRYFPSSGLEFGGFSVFANFTSDNEVILTSDIDDEQVTSYYSVIAESGPILTFNTYNPIIHFFSEPGGDNGIGAVDSGLKGDFEFIILEVKDGVITLKGKKSGNIITMTPVSDATMVTAAEKYQEASVLFDEFAYFKLEDKAGQMKGLTLNYRTFQLADDANSELFSFRVTPGGLDFYKEYELEGVKFQSLSYVAPTGNYVLGYYTDNSKTFKIVPFPMPLNLWFYNNSWAFAYSGVGTTGQTYWNTAKTQLTNNGYTLTNVNIGEYFGYKAISFALNNRTIRGGVTYTITPVAGTEDEVRLAFGGGLLNEVGFSATQWTAGLNQLSTPLNGRTFKITATTLDRPGEILLSDKGIPTNTFRLKLGLNSINDPFNK